MGYLRTHTGKLGFSARDWLIVAVAVAIIVAPLWLTSSGFAIDFNNHLWLTWVAGKTLLQTGHPSYFVSDPGFVGVFYPFYAFYGGTLYTITGGVSDLLGGHAVLAFSLVTTLAVAASYTGMLWLARELGLRGGYAHVPSLVVITSAYYISDLYGRGAWPEFIAGAMIAPLLASGLHLARTPRWRVLPMLAFVVSVVLFTGSHNITLVWGTTMIAVALIVIWITQGAPRRLPYGRLFRMAGLAVISALVNAWFLLPNAVYAKHTIGGIPPIGKTVGEAYDFFNTPAMLFNPLRHVPSQANTLALYVQVPDWFLGWALITGGLLLWRRGLGSLLQRVWLGMLALFGLLLAMLMIHSFWEVAPFPLNEIQFSYRLGIYVYYAIAGLVLVSVIALQRAAAQESLRTLVARLRIGLVAVCLVSAGLCVWQTWISAKLYPGSLRNRNEALVGVHTVPSTWYDGGFYRDAQTPIVPVAEGRQLLIDPNLIQGDRYSELMNVPPGRAPIQTNIAGGSYIAHISGLERLGRNSIGYTVVRRPDNGSGPVRVTIETTHSPVIELGWAASVLALLAILAILIHTALSARGARRRGPAPRTHSDPPHALADSPYA